MNYITNPLITANYSAYRLPQVVKTESSTIAPETQAPVADMPVPQMTQTEAVIVDLSPEVANTFALIGEGKSSDGADNQTGEDTGDKNSVGSLAGINEEEDENEDEPTSKRIGDTKGIYGTYLHGDKKSLSKTKAGDIVTINTEEGAKQAVVVKAGKFNVDVDTNHPLAGKVLTFEIQIESVREATEEELSHGHAHGVGGHHH